MNDWNLLTLLIPSLLNCRASSTSLCFFSLQLLHGCFGQQRVVVLSWRVHWFRGWEGLLWFRTNYDLHTNFRAPWTSAGHRTDRGSTLNEQRTIEEDKRERV